MPDSLLHSFRGFVRQEQLFTTTDKLLLACSGGLDSTTLAHLLAAEGYAFALVHCNFQLRGAASDGDEKFVKILGDRLGVPVHSVTLPIKKEAGSKQSTQMLARESRYNHFKKILDEYSYDLLVTAHHLDDSLETVLINLMRGTGLQGLTGIPVRYGSNVRPLLNCSRKDILAYATAHDLSWREDASNDTDNYLRNRLRHHVTPLLREFGLQESSLQRTLERLRSEANLLSYGYEWWRERAVTNIPDGVEVDRSQLAANQVRVNQLLLKKFSPNLGFTDEQYRQMLAVQGRPTLFATGGRVDITPETFTFTSQLATPEEQGSEITELPFVHQSPEWTYLLEEVERPASFNDPSTLYFRPTPLPLHLRPRQNGDRFQPFGMRGKSKKVKDYLTDEKLTDYEKDRMLLLCADDGRIMAVHNSRGSEAFRVRPQDARVLRLTVKHKRPG